MNLEHHYNNIVPIYMCESSVKETKDNIDGLLNLKVCTFKKYKEVYRLLKLVNNLIDMTKIDCDSHFV